VPRLLGNTGLELWPGYSASVRLNAGLQGRSSLAMVVDLAASAFVCAQPVTSYVSALCAGAQLTPRNIRAASKALRGLKVECRFVDTRTGKERRRSHRCKGLTLQAAAGAMFDSDTGSKESVAAYYQRAYGLKLAQPGLPCVDASISKARPCWIPMELCTIVAGQRRVMVDDAVAAAAMIRETATRPQERAKRIEAEMRGVAQLPTLAAFGMRVSPAMTQLQGRVLDTPTMEYGGGKFVAIEPGKGAWSALRERLPLAGVAPRAWGAVALDDRHLQPLRAFMPQFAGAMDRNAGVRLPPTPLVLAAARGEMLEDTLRRCARELTAKAGAGAAGAAILLIVVMPSISDDYIRIKALLDQGLGIVSQVMLSKHLGGGNVSGGAGGRGGDGGRGGGRGGGDESTVDRLYLGNLALKVSYFSSVVCAPLIHSRSAGEREAGRRQRADQAHRARHRAHRGPL